LYQQQLPDSLKDGTLKKAVVYRMIKIMGKGAEDRLEPVRELMERFFHAFPQLLFISLPIFAFILHMLYIRRKQFLYVDHVIFTVHFFCAAFIFILVMALSSKLQKVAGMVSLVFSVLSILLTLFYLKSRHFYGGPVKDDP
jgi:hypothetical protein